MQSTRNRWIKAALGLLVAICIAWQFWRLANLGKRVGPGEISLLASIAVLVLPGIVTGILFGVPLALLVNRRLGELRWNIVVRRLISAAIILGCAWVGLVLFFWFAPM